jgi:hypothetical protein
LKAKSVASQDQRCCILASIVVGLIIDRRYDKFL